MSAILKSMLVLGLAGAGVAAAVLPFARPRATVSLPAREVRAVVARGRAGAVRQAVAPAQVGGTVDLYYLSAPAVATGYLTLKSGTRAAPPAYCTLIAANTTPAAIRAMTPPQVGFALKPWPRAPVNGLENLIQQWPDFDQWWGPADNLPH